MNIKDEIKKTIETNDTCLFMKGTPDSPQCGFSMAVSNLLKHLNVNFKGINEFGSGGMNTKIEAAKICQLSGCNMIIANGLHLNPIEKIINHMKIS